MFNSRFWENQVNLFTLKYSSFVNTRAAPVCASLSHHELVCSAKMFWSCAVTVIYYVHTSMCSCVNVICVNWLLSSCFSLKHNWFIVQFNLKGDNFGALCYWSASYVLLEHTIRQYYYISSIGCGLWVTSYGDARITVLDAIEVGRKHLKQQGFGEEVPRPGEAKGDHGERATMR